MDRVGDNADEMWDEKDGFFYDLLRLPDGNAVRLKVRSMVGLLPLCAATVFDPEVAERFPRLLERTQALISRHPDCAFLAWGAAPNGRRVMSIMTPDKLPRVLARLFDEQEFFAPQGIRSLSKAHRDNPFEFMVGGTAYRVDCLPAESNTEMFGGNSNWRGPIWMPVNLLIIRALLQYYLYYGNDFTIEVPTGSGNRVTLHEATRILVERIASTFLRGPDGLRPVYGGAQKFQEDPHWRDLILFYEYFHGDNGAGLGASHQTGWTGLIAVLLAGLGGRSADELLAQGRQPPARKPRERKLPQAASPRTSRRRAGTKAS
jgi:hypothetical protein